MAQTVVYRVIWQQVLKREQVFFLLKLVLYTLNDLNGFQDKNDVAMLRVPRTDYISKICDYIF